MAASCDNKSHIRLFTLSKQTFPFLKQPISYGFIDNKNKVTVMAIHKTRNTGTGNGMRGTRGMGGGRVISYSGECPQTFQGILPNILGNVAKHSREYCQASQGM